MRTAEESKEVAKVFNLDPDIVKEYVQFGSVFNLLHAGASYLRIHQRGFGAVGVSKKYGDRSFARYPIFWGLPKIGQLPNPDPSDTKEWSKDEQENIKDVIVDEDRESKRGELRIQAQKWAGLKVDPDADLFVFVGRWSLQKGIDLIADIFPSILDKYPSTQLICVGPTIDLYGKFAALKLQKLVEQYPGRVYSKPEFTALPPYIFSGAEFALIPSRDEPFGLVAVEFGSKGALGVGARVGGLGQMPGFWYTIESTAPSHLLHQFRGAIISALKSKRKTRVLMRAWSTQTRFPVAQWLQDLETLQSEAIRLHEKVASKRKKFSSRPSLAVPGLSYNSDSTEASPRLSATRPRSSSSGTVTRHSRASSLSRQILASRGEESPASTPGTSRSPSRTPQLHVTEAEPEPDATDSLLPPNPLHANPFYNLNSYSSSESLATVTSYNDRQQGYDAPSGAFGLRSAGESTDSLSYRMMAPDSAELPTPPLLTPSAGLTRGLTHHANSSLLSVDEVVGGRTDYKLQKVDPFFNDTTGEYYRAFEKQLAGLTARNSENDLCIEEYLVESERDWSKRFRNAKLGRSKSPRGGRVSILSANASSNNSLAPSEVGSEDRIEFDAGARDDEFLLGSGYKPPTGLKKYATPLFLFFSLWSWIPKSSSSDSC